MKAIAIGTRRQAILFGVLAVLLLFFVVKWSSKARAPEGASSTAPSVAVVSEGRPSRGGRRAAPTPGADEIPLLTARDLDPRWRAGSQATTRDLFDPREPTKPPPPPPTPAPPPPPAPGHPAYIGPLPPPAPTPTPTPPDPPFKLIGIFGPRDRPIAVLTNGDEIINARAGDILFARWIIRKVGYESIDVGFVGFPSTETRRLPITQ
jgi:hypothetical protein